MKFPDRKPGHLYVVLGSSFDIQTHSHVEPFVEVEDHEGKSVLLERMFPEGTYRLLEFPSPAAHEALQGRVLNAEAKYDHRLGELTRTQAERDAAVAQVAALQADVEALVDRVRELEASLAFERDERVRMEADEIPRLEAERAALRGEAKP